MCKNTDSISYACFNKVRNSLRSRSHVFFVRDFGEVTHFLILGGVNMEETNYKELYYSLSAIVADVIEKLTEKQIELEEIYINQNSDNE